MKIVNALWEYKLQMLAHLYIGLSVFMFTESVLGTLLIAPIALVSYIAIAEELEGDTVIGVIVVPLPETEDTDDIAEAIAEDISKSGDVPVKLMILSAEEVQDIRDSLTDED